MTTLVDSSPEAEPGLSLFACPASPTLSERQENVPAGFRLSSRLSASAATLCLAADEEIDLLAQRAASSPTAFLSLLQLLRPRLYCAASLQSAAPLPSASSLSSEHRRVQAHFSKLKLAFLHLEAKQKFLSWLQRQEAVPRVTGEELQQAEADIAAGRQAVAELKDSEQGLSAAIAEMLESLAGGWLGLEQEAERMQEQWSAQDWQELQQLMDETGEAELSSLLSQPWLDARLAEQQQQQAELTAALAASHSAQQQQQREMQRVQARTEEMEEETQALLRSLQPESGTALRWWQAMLSTTQSLSGLELRQGRTERSLVLRVRGWQSGSETEGAELEVDCVPGTTRFNGVRLLSGALESEALDAAVDYALDTQQLAFLVHEIQSMLSDC